MSYGLIESRSLTSHTPSHPLSFLHSFSVNCCHVFFLLFKKTKRVGTEPESKVNRKKVCAYVYVSVFTCAKPTDLLSKERGVGHTWDTAF